MVYSSLRLICIRLGNNSSKTEIIWALGYPCFIATSYVDKNWSNSANTANNILFKIFCIQFDF